MPTGSCLFHPMGKLFSKSKSKSDTYGTRYEDHPSYTGQDNAVATVCRFPSSHSDAVTSVAAVTPGVCVSGSKDQSVVLFDYNSGQMRQKWTGHQKEVTKVVYGSAAQVYLSASRDKQVFMWDVTRPDPIKTFNGHDLVVTGLALNDDNSQMCSGSRDNWMKLWDINTGQCLTQNCISRNLITDIKWARNSNLLAQTGEDKEFRIWDASALKVVKAFPRKQYIQTCCDFSSDNNYCVTSSNGFQGSGCEATLWDIRSGGVVHEFKGHMETVSACCFLPLAATAGRALIATSSNDCTIKIWDKNSAVCLSTLSLAGSGPLTSLAAYEDGSICVASFNEGVYVLKMAVSPAGDVSLSQIAQY